VFFFQALGYFALLSLNPSFILLCSEQPIYLYNKDCSIDHSSLVWTSSFLSPP
jgi:hypothetical protein